MVAALATGVLALGGRKYTLSILVTFRSLYTYGEDLELASRLALECHEIPAWYRKRKQKHRCWWHRSQRCRASRWHRWNFLRRIKTLRALEPTMRPSQSGRTGPLARKLPHPLRQSRSVL